MDVLILVARLVLAAVFLVSGLAKLFDLAGSQKAMRDFGLPEPVARIAGLGLPVAELLVAVLLLPTVTAPWAGWGAVVLLAAFIAGISYNLARGNTPDCHCFGQLQSEPIGPATLIRNGVLVAIALFIGIAGAAYGPGPSIVDWTQNMDGLAWVVLIGGLIIIAALAGVVWMLVHLLGQNGRLLVRLDRIEDALADADIALDEEEEDEDAFEEGLPFGSPAPAFGLTGLHGERMTLDALRAAGNPVLLVFTDPTCRPCNALLPDIGKWQREYRSKLTVALISRGSPEDYLAKSAEHGLTNVLLQEKSEVADAYQSGGTPTGLLVSADGMIGSGLAPGSDAIRRLVTQAIENKVAIPIKAAAKKPAPAPAAARGADKIGTAAPEVALPNLAGETVTLADFKGAPTALLFWNPGCGFCQRMIPELKAWEENPPADAPKLLVVSTGDAERNAEMGLKSPIVLDSGFNTGRAFGASGTPSALLINAEGEIATGVAVGAPGVLGILRNDAPTPAPVIFEDEDDEEDEADPEGPPIGSAAPAVRLPDLDGNMIDLADHRGTRTLLLFWNPGCGFCERMLPEIKKWEQKPPKGAPKLVVVSSGSAEANRAQGLRSLTLLDDEFAVGSDFGSDGTPSAIMIDAQGRVASGLVVGAPEVMKLAKSTRDPAPPVKV
ncbi:MAG: redoxin domain-containing protein [Chloroflexia bacterium]|nr:redoxin domain-containing protein [Chloroflexia bacterium]